MPKIYTHVDYSEYSAVFISEENTYGTYIELDVDQDFLNAFNKAREEYFRLMEDLARKHHAEYFRLEKEKDTVESIKAAKSRTEKHSILVDHGWNKEDVSTYSKDGVTLMMHEAFDEVKRKYLGYNVKKNDNEY